MKLLHVAASYLPATRYGGTIVSVHGLCKALAVRGHDVHVFTTSIDGPDDSPVVHNAPTSMDGVSVHYFQSRMLRRLFYAPDLSTALSSTIATFDLVHTHAIYLAPLWSAARAARAARVPYVVSPRGMLEKSLIERKSALWKALLIAFVERRHLEGASAIHVTSRRERDEAAAFGFDLPPLFEVPNGVDAPVAQGEASPAITALGSQKFVLFLGRINWKKGLNRIIAAMALVPELKLVIAGPDENGYRRVVEDLAAAHDVASRVVFSGPANAADKAALFRMACALVLPSYSENFGNVVIEAWAEGCPVIVTPEVGLADAVSACGGGWVVKGTPQELAGAIDRVAGSQALRQQAGERGRAEGRRRYTWSAVAEQMEAVYEYATTHGPRR
jgi:glycosyltransferase involved in cell wall biosynthesis